LASVGPADPRRQSLHGRGCTGAVDRLGSPFAATTRIWSSSGQEEAVAVGYIMDPLTWLRKGLEAGWAGRNPAATVSRRPRAGRKAAEVAHGS